MGMEKSEDGRPGVWALCWTGAQMKLGLAGGFEGPAAPKKGFWERVDGWPEWILNALCWGALTAFCVLLIWVSGWVGALGAQGWCAVASCERSSVALAPSSALSNAQWRDLEAMGVEPPASARESLSEGASVAGVGQAAREEFLKSLDQGWARWQKQQDLGAPSRELMEAGRLALLGQSVELAKGEAAAALARAGRERAIKKALVESARAWVESAPRISADWAGVRAAVAPWRTWIAPARREPSDWALAQARGGEARGLGLVLLFLAMWSPLAALAARDWARKKASAYVEADRDRLTRAWEASQLSAAAKGAEASRERRRL